MKIDDVLDKATLDIFADIDGFFIQIHKNFKPLFVSDRYMDFFGYENKNEFLNNGSIFDQILDEDRAEAISRYELTLNQGWSPQHTLKVRCVDGSYGWLRIQDKRVSYSGEQCVMSFMVIIDEEIQAIENAERAADLEKQARVVLQRIQSVAIENEKKSALNYLLSGLSNQLSGPVDDIENAGSAIDKMLVDIRNELYSNELTPGVLLQFFSIAQDNVDEIRSSTKRVDELIQCIRRVTLDSGVVANSAFRPAQLIVDTLDILTKENADFTLNCECELDENLSIISNPNIWRQLITILFENALIHGFYGASEGCLRLHLFTEGDTVLFRFSDDGVGIPLKDRSRVFDAFYSSHECQGTGLGLTLAKKLVTRDLSGEFNLVESELKTGCTFEVRLTSAIKR